MRHIGVFSLVEIIEALQFEDVVKVVSTLRFPAEELRLTIPFTTAFEHTPVLVVAFRVVAILMVLQVGSEVLLRTIIPGASLEVSGPWDT